MQWGRVYKLAVGNEEEGWLIWDLNIVFEVDRKSGEKDSKSNSKIIIYNLSKDKIRFLENSYVNVTLDVGYYGTNLTRLITGQVVNVEVDKSGGDVATKLVISESFTELNHKIITKLIPDGRKVRDALLEIVNNTPSIDRAVFTGSNVEREIVDGYPINATGREALDDLSRSYNFEYTIERGILYTSDYDKPTNKEIEAVLLNQDTGLIGSPTKYEDSKGVKEGSERAVKGIQFRSLLNATLVVGSLVKVESSTYSGVYKLKEVKYFGEMMGNDWYCDCIAVETLYE